MSNRHPQSLQELLFVQAARHPDKLAYAMLTAGAEVQSARTFSQLFGRAMSIAFRLRQQLAPGERAVLLYPQGVEFIEAFFGCMLARLIAVPAHLPDLADLSRGHRYTQKLYGIAKDCQAGLVLTSNNVEAHVQTLLAGDARTAALPCLSTDSDFAASEDLPAWAAETNDIAALIYTSGSTGDPKGVTVQHGNLLRNLQIVTDKFQNDADATCVSWLPLFHDLGLVVAMLGSLRCGASCYLMDAAEFISKPIRWLRAISRFRARNAGGPNFAFEICVRKTSAAERQGLDLSSWQVAFNGAEPVRAETIARFSAMFAESGFRKECFYPCYGMAEATGIVTGGHLPAGPKVLYVEERALAAGMVTPVSGPTGARALVAYGQPGDGEEVAIVDPQTSARCAEGQVGEVWIRGRSIGPGYFGRPDASRESFQAVCAGEEGAHYLRSGDLGFLHAGELYLTGRLKDVIIVYGTNHYPQDIEYTAENAHPVIRKGGCAAFALQDGPDERLGLVVELAAEGAPNAAALHAEVLRALRAALSEQHALPIGHIALVPPRSILKTTSGKLRRQATREALHKGRLPILAEWLVDATELTGAGPKEHALQIAAHGRLDGLRLVEVTEPARSLAATEVRVVMQAVGLNFRDVLNLLGLYPEASAAVGYEGAGIVQGVGPGVTALLPGDRVMGLFPHAAATSAVTDCQRLVRIPEGLPFAQAAALPVAFLTAHYTLQEAVRLKSGMRVLIHCATGGVGLAAVQVARLCGAEVFATASEPKWSLLRELGFADSHIASSRNLDFAAQFMRETHGQGVDVVLNSLTQEFVDASLALLASGGHFIELGKRDVRDAQWLHKTHPAVNYTSFDLDRLSLDQVQATLQLIVRQLEQGQYRPLPITSFTTAQADAALRRMARAEHTGKLVLSPIGPLPDSRFSQTAPAADFLRAELTTLSAQSGRLRIEALIVYELSRLLGQAASEMTVLELERPFRELGLDSLKAVELRSALEQRTGVPLSATVAFDYPTVRALTQWLFEQVRDPSVSAGPAAAPQVPKTSAKQDEAIAIIGMACRFPGGVKDPEGLWELLKNETDAIQQVPADRWDIDAYYDPAPDAAGKMTTRWGGFLQGVQEYEPGFFGISPREAVSIDPQQRLLLETSWEAIERAGIASERLQGSDTGVYIGVCGNEYHDLVMEQIEAINAYSLLGTAHSASVGRLSYWLGLRGPNFPVDTACSSALVALHLACQALRSGECTMALAGGVNLTLLPEFTVYFSRLRAMSPTGRCRTFSDDADGYVRSEGCGVVVLKRLSDAQRDGDPIRAVIRGTAVNQDGRSNGLTAPSGPAQEAVIRRALAQAAVEPAQVGYVEAHGTGTPLGDPIEVRALATVLGKGRPSERPVVVGSIKSNIGHTEGAAGMAGLIKAVLCLEHREIPKTLHFRAPNPRIPWTELKVEVAKERREWKVENGARRIAGVSSFGFSGTNAHVVLEEAPEGGESAEVAERGAELVVMSAKSEAALRAQAERLLAHVQRHPEQRLGDVAYSLATTRSAMEKRLALVVRSREELIKKLEVAARGQVPEGGVRGTAGGKLGKRAFLFAGQGAQVLGMGRGLYRAWPAFRKAWDRCEELMNQELPRPLREVVWAKAESTESKLLDQTGYTQPALFAVEYAMWELWKSWGVRPEIVAGHSVGELLAACAGGMFTLEEAVKLCMARGRLMQGLPAGGGMAAVGAGEAEVRKVIKEYGGEVEIAAVNGPDQVVIAGEQRAVKEVGQKFAKKGIRTRELEVSHAFHTARMEPMLAAFLREAEKVKYRRAELAIVSNVSGRMGGEEMRSGEYWAKHVREAVRFGDGVKAMREEGVGTFVEVGPSRTILGMVAANVGEEEVRMVGSLRGKPEQEEENILQAVGGWWAEGQEVDWRGLFPDGGRRVELPTYPWQRQRYWVDTARAPAGIPGRHGRWRLSGVQLELPGEGVHHVITVSTQLLPFLQDHLIFGRVIIPGAFYVSVMLSIAAELWPGSAVELADVQFLRVLELEPDKEVELHASLLRSGDGESYQCEFLTRVGQTEGEWVTHARGRVQTSDRAPGELSIPDRVPAHDAMPLPVERMFEFLSNRKVDWGPRWRWMTEAHAGGGLAAYTLTATEESVPHLAPLHPAMLDNAFVGGLFTRMLAAPQEARPELPFGVEWLRFWQVPVGQLRGIARVRDGRDNCADSVITDETGQVVAEVRGFTSRHAPPELVFRKKEAAAGEAFYRLAWPEAGPAASSAVDAEGWLVARRSSASAQELSRRMAMQWKWIEPQEISRALAAGEAPQQLVYLWEAEEQEAPDVAAQRMANEGLELVKALLGRSLSRLLWVTRSAVAVHEKEVPDVSAATLWGLGRTVMNEHPELGLRLVDVEAGDAKWEALERELAHRDAENQVAWRHGRRHQARLVRAGAAADGGTRLRLDGTVLITGGLGALGMKVAKALAEQGMRHLLLTGRRGKDTPATADAIRELESLGSEVTLAAVDVADRAAMQRVLAAVPKHKPLRGVVHAAGVLDDGMLREQTAERFVTVLKPKVAGAWNLHQLLEGQELDLFVMFSSAAGLLGSAGQSNYAAANAFLDALAAQRRAQGLAGQSLSWGAWADGGMAAALGAAQQARLARQGMAPLPTDTALALLARAVERAEAHLAILNLDPAVAGQSLGAEVPPLWRTLLSGAAARPERAATANWAGKIAQLAPEQRESEVRAAVQADVARVLSLGEGSVVPLDLPFAEMGLDSLLAVDLRSALGKRIGATLPATVAFDHPTVRALAQWLLAQVLERTARAPAPVIATPAAAPPQQEDAIAIIGMACRFPGGVKDPEGLWELLKNETDAIQQVPAERWDIDAYYDPDPDAAGKMTTRWGGFLAGVKEYEPGFFGISPREAVSIDPQQRLLLETSWEAIERAGIASERLQGSDTGVYIGVCGNEYHDLVMEQIEAINAYSLLGTAHSASVGRLSYWLGLRGPNFPVDTACSSALVALHLACQALRSGECTMALAGGVNLTLLPEFTVYFSRLRAMSPTGRCRTFSDDADGYVRSEGCGVVVLKRLSDAQRDGDPIRAVIRGTAVNQDGRSNGLTAPSGPAQEAVIRRALAQAAVEPAQVGYVEAHGTGTPLGDPIEVRALATVLGKGRPSERPVVVGSIKSNIGHTEGAAGMAGLIKAVLCLEHREIPKTLHFRAPNPRIPWTELKVEVAKERREWKVENGARRIAGVSSFGFSGTNAHVVLEEAPEPRARAEAADREAALVVMSAKSEAALREQAERLLAHVERHPEQRLGDVAYSLATTRSAMEKRLALVVRSREELIKKLEVAARGQTPEGGVREGGKGALETGKENILQTLGGLWAAGQEVDWKVIFPEGGQRVELPTYPWQRQPYWLGDKPLPAPALTEPLPRPVTPDSAETAAPTRLSGLRPAEVPAQLAAVVREVVAEILGHREADALDAEQGFSEQGLDSLMAVQLRNRLQAELGIQLAKTIAFDHPNLNRLTAHLLARVFNREEAQVAPTRMSRSAEAIAIVGAACRLPGGIEDLQEYWKLLARAGIAITEVPPDRWQAADFYDENPEAANRTYTKHGGFLRDVQTFDAAYFRIAPREAVSLDPQQRLLLEVGIEALENAGQDPAALRDSPTGVFIGVGLSEYGELVEHADEAAKMYAATGNAASVTAGRISFILGLRGPTLAVDTACSSSLVALHLACQSLRDGECERALVGGVNVLASPRLFVLLSRLGALSPSGRCKTFTAAADGYVRAEGCAVMVLKRLSDAQRDGDAVLGVIRGTAINHDGASGGLTVPNGPAQQALLRAALLQSGLSPSEIDFVECHGTGTRLGDPIEVQALGAVYGGGRPREKPLVLGAVKANVGHLEAAAGLTGVLKVLLALRHEQIPAQPALDELNPDVPWSELPVAVAASAVPWPRSERPRRAGVSSFGMSGTNAHVILEEAPACTTTVDAPARSAELVVLSGRSEAAMWAQAARLRAHLQEHADVPLGALAYSLASTRSAHEHRLALVSLSRADLLAQLDTAASLKTPSRSMRNQVHAAPGRMRSVVFVFPGQGGQWLGMGRSLLAEEPIFRDAFMECERAIRQESGFSILAELHADEASTQLARTDIVQPMLFAISVALAAWWRAAGVVPHAVVGHSMGEVAAAHVAGALSLADAVTIICRRSRLLRNLSGKGGMAMVGLPLAEAAAALSGYESCLYIAASNSPRATVIVGETTALDAFLARLEQRHVFCRRLKVDGAGHSPQVDPLCQELLAALSHLRPQHATLPICSAVTGRLVEGSELRADYWADNMRQPVQFTQAVQTLLDRGHGLFLEMSAHPTLVNAIEEIQSAAQQPVAVVKSLRKGQGERQALLESLGALWSLGYPLAWDRLFPAGTRRVELPTYPWQRQRYWVEPMQKRPQGAAADPAGLSDLLRRLAERDGLSTEARAVLPELLAALEKERGEAAQADAVVPGSYVVQWRPQGLGGLFSDASGRWLLLFWEEAEAAMAAAVKRAGGTPVHLRDLAALRAELAGGAKVRVVLCAAAPHALGERRLGEVLQVLQLLAGLGQAAPRLWLLTRQAVSARSGEVPANPEQAILWGLLRTFLREHPVPGGGLIDLSDLPGDGDVADRIVAVAAGQSDEDQWALRAEGALLARLVRTELPARRVWRTPGAVLLTQGLSAMGLRLARWLARRGTRDLLLIAAGESPRAEVDVALAELRSAGVTVHLCAADPQALSAAIRNLPSGSRISAVFQLPNLAKQAPLAELTEHELLQTLAARREETQVLDALAAGCELDTFVCFSSIAGVWGASGHGAQAAGDAFLDAWAIAARARGLRAVAISWGAWEGADRSPPAVLRLAGQGLAAMDESAGLVALERALSGDAPHLIVSDLAWDVIQESVGSHGRRALLEELLTGAQSSPAGETLRSKLSAVDGQGQKTLLEQFLREELAAVLRIPMDALGVAEPLSNLGMDSIMALELRRRVYTSLSVPLSATDLLGNASLSSIARRVLALLDLPEAGSGAGSGAFLNGAPAASITGRQVTGPHFIPPAYPEEFPDGGLRATSYTAATGRTFEVIERGAGRRIMLLPPVWSEAIIWKPVIEQLAPAYAVSSLNLPGYGRSLFRGEFSDIAELAAEVAAVLATANAEAPVDLVGWSFGGLLAQVLAVHHPELVRTLTLVNTSLCPLAGLDFPSETLLLRMISGELARDLRRNEASAKEAERLSQWGSAARQAIATTHYMKLVREFDYRVHARAIHTPTLIVCGAEDTVTSAAQHGAPLHRAIAGSKLEVVADVGHYIPLLRPGAFASLLSTWISASGAHP